MTHVAVLPGDGIGPEVTAEAIRVLERSGSATPSTPSAATRSSRRGLRCRPRRSPRVEPQTRSSSPRLASPSSKGRQ